MRFLCGLGSLRGLGNLGLGNLLGGSLLGGLGLGGLLGYLSLLGGSGLLGGLSLGGLLLGGLGLLLSSGLLDSGLQREVIRMRTLASLDPSTPEEKREERTFLTVFLTTFLALAASERRNRPLAPTPLG